MTAALRPLDLDGLGALSEQETEAALTAADALRDEYLAWREERGLEPSLQFQIVLDWFVLSLNRENFPMLPMGCRGVVATS